MKCAFALFLAQILCLCYCSQEAQDLLKVSIYYESLCPYSVKFIKKQFYPAYRKIGDSLNVDFVPYGNAEHVKKNGKWKFTCQHDEEECWGNTAQACGLAADADQDQKVKYINCMMDQNDPASEKAVKRCAHKVGVTSDSILKCIEDGRGDDLHAQYGDRSQDIDFSDYGVPFVVFNDRRDFKVAEEAYDNFLDVACSLLPSGTKGCPTSENTEE